MATGQALTNLYQVGALAGGVRNALPYDSTSGAFRGTRNTVADFGRGSPKRLGPAAGTQMPRQAPGRMQQRRGSGPKAPALKKPTMRSSLGRRR